MLPLPDYLADVERLLSREASMTERRFIARMHQLNKSASEAAQKIERNSI